MGVNQLGRRVSSELLSFEPDFLRISWLIP
jgi:hypothetical protein